MIFDTEIAERCSDGSSFIFHWSPGLNRFRQDGDHVRAFAAYDRRSPSGEPLRYEDSASVHMGDAPRGTIRARAIVGGNVSCASGDVTFTLRRAR